MMALSSTVSRKDLAHFEYLTTDWPIEEGMFYLDANRTLKRYTLENKDAMHLLWCVLPEEHRGHVIFPS